MTGVHFEPKPGSGNGQAMVQYRSLIRSRTSARCRVSGEINVPVGAMNIILIAGPAFLLLVLVEYLYGRWRGNDTYQLNDTLNSISLGAISRLTGLTIRIGAHAWVLKHVALFEMPANSLWTWISALVFYDFTYYWSHRFGHTMNLFWAHHVVHHQSERYNLPTALRQGSFGFFGFIFGLPLAMCGYPVEVVAIVGVIDLYYQYWIHTEHIGKLGWFDRVFASPSNHRVHHAVNDAYVDKNYGGKRWLISAALFAAMLGNSILAFFGVRARMRWRVA